MSASLTACILTSKLVWVTNIELVQERAWNQHVTKGPLASEEGPSEIRFEERCHLNPLNDQHY